MVMSQGNIKVRYIGKWTTQVEPKGRALGTDGFMNALVDFVREVWVELTKYQAIANQAGKLRCKINQ